MAASKKYRLLAHPTSPAPQLALGVKATIIGSDVLKLEYVVTGPIADILIPEPMIPVNAEGLWQNTCFELFVRTTGDSYVEYNFSPSRCYAMYGFDGYRDGLQPRYDLPAPAIYIEHNSSRFELDAWVDIKRLSAGSSPAIGISAVVETTEGAKSYWALAHPPGAPDFHHPACFAARLPAPDGV